MLRPNYHLQLTMQHIPLYTPSTHFGQPRTKSSHFGMDRRSLLEYVQWKMFPIFQVRPLNLHCFHEAYHRHPHIRIRFQDRGNSPHFPAPLLPWLRYANSTHYPQLCPVRQREWHEPHPPTSETQGSSARSQHRLTTKT